MFYCNEIIGLNVLSLYEGELLGKVDKLFFDKKLKKLLEIEIIGENETRFLLSTKNIYHIGKNAITVKNNQSVNLKVEENSLSLAPVGSKAYSIKGEYLGIVKDFVLSDKFLGLKFLLDNNSSVEINRLASSGKCTIIFYEESQHINLNKFTPKPKFFKNKKTKKENAQPAQEKEEIKPEVLNNNAVEVEHPKQNSSADFLIGRICTKDIFNFNNEVLIKEHSVVNKKNLKEINKYGKLRELMLYSK